MVASVSTERLFDLGGVLFILKNNLTCIHFKAILDVESEGNPMSAETIFSVRMKVDLKKRIKIFCAKNDVTMEDFIKEAVVAQFEQKGRYGDKNDK